MAGGDPTCCDYYLESANGCQVHGMELFFGGQQADPQGVIIKDDSTGTWGIGRNTITATSIISDTVWGAVLAEIWCNSGGNPLQVFMANALMVSYRDESGYSDSLAIVGAGPIGGYAASCVAQNADGYRFIVSPMLDGYTWQGLKVNGNLNITKYQPGMGLRFCLGADPALPTQDYFSLGQGTPQVWEPRNYAAGTATCEMRIVKSTQVQPSTPDQHQMVVPIDYGMWGWVWDASGNRTAVMGLTNPYWIAINMMLRALGIYGDPSTGSNPAGGSGPSSATQLAAFVLASLVNSETWTDASGNRHVGSGCGQIADLQVPAILGTGTETQFQFQGSLTTGKPFRDWLTQVVEYALGYYTFEFGALKLGCRINASSTDAYSPANTLFRTLRLQPIVAAYEKMVLSYADINYQYQANTATYADKDHAAYYGRAGSLLKTDMHSVGTCTLSQGLRYAATRTREEVGGVIAHEWRDARTATWQTTLLGLGNEVGKVVSMTDPEIPGIHGKCNVSGNTATWASGDTFLYAGTTNGDTELISKDIMIGGQQVTIIGVASDGSSITTSPAPPAGTGLAFQVITMCFRLEKWSLKKDWSIELQGKTVTASMYDLDVGPKPVDVAPAPMPSLFQPIPFGPAWAPYQIQAASWDALFANEWTFDSDQTYTPLKDSSSLASLAVTGKLPVNQFSATGAGAPGIPSVTQSATGGSLPANSTLWAAVCALDANGQPSAPSNIVIIGTGAAAGGTFTLNVNWPAVAGLTSYVLFVGIQPDLICAQGLATFGTIVATGLLTPGTGGTTYTPSTITFGGPVARSTWALPSPYVAKVRIKAKRGVHFGVAGVGVDSVTAPNQIVCSELVDTTNTPFNPVGRIVSVVGRENGSTPFLSMTITAFARLPGSRQEHRRQRSDGHAAVFQRG